MTEPKPTCARCRTPLVIRQAGPVTVVCCWRCPVPAVVSCSSERAVKEWRRREAAKPEVR